MIALLFSFLTVAPASAGAAALTIRVQDAAAHPVGTATVYFLGEDRHRVESKGGTWRGDALHGANATAFTQGTVVTFYAGAPGYTPQRIEQALLKAGGNEIVVTLAAFAPTAATVTPLADAALAAHRTWIDAEAADAKAPSKPTAEAAYSARVALAAAARAWIAEGPKGLDGVTARVLCIASDARPETCG